MQAGPRATGLRAMLFVCVAATGMAAVEPATAEPSRSGRVEFEVLRGGRPFGTQSAVVTQRHGELIADTNADLRADLGPLNVFRYSQSCREVWRNGRLADLSCRTRRNGRDTRLTARAQAGSLQFTNARGTNVLPAETWPTTWWTRPQLGARTLLNTDTGRPMNVRVSRIGREPIDIAGETLMAEHIRVAGTLTLDLWYAENGSWIGAAFEINGQQITYRLISPHRQGPA